MKFPAPGRDEIHFIFVPIDTLRADHLGIAGYYRQTSPYLDRISRQSAYFHTVLSQSSFTPPSHASIFTSLYVTIRLRALFYSAFSFKHLLLSVTLFCSFPGSTLRCSFNAENTEDAEILRDLFFIFFQPVYNSAHSGF
ncbi:sulfatase-like hydrolase/transferase [bacterium]|nr:sulfatase-like hydrolase/transferase [bacterium]